MRRRKETAIKKRRIGDANEESEEEEWQRHLAQMEIHRGPGSKLAEKDPHYRATETARHVDKIHRRQVQEAQIVLDCLVRRAAKSEMKLEDELARFFTECREKLTAALQRHNLVLCTHCDTLIPTEAARYYYEPLNVLDSRIVTECSERPIDIGLLTQKEDGVFYHSDGTPTKSGIVHVGHPSQLEIALVYRLLAEIDEIETTLHPLRRSV